MLLHAPVHPATTTPDPDFDAWAHQGNHHLSAGRLREAAECYRRASVVRPDAGLLHNLAVACARSGAVDEAIHHFHASLEVRPDSSDTARNLGVAYSQKGQPAEAETWYRRALVIDPANAQAHYDYGNLHLALGKFEDATAQFQQALRHRPEFAAAHHGLGRAMGRQGKHGEAIPHFEQALRYQHDLGDAHHDLGIALQELGRHDDAATAFRRALRFSPRSPLLHANLGVALAELGQDEDSLAAYQEALRLAPDAVETHNNLGNSLRMMGRLEQAEHHFRRALELKPDDAGVYNNLGIVHVYAGRTHEALACYERALELAPEFPSAHLNRSFALLTIGDCERGWEEYEWRWKEKNVGPREFTQPLWDGSPLNGQSILLYAEQGFGDTLQFVRYAPLVKERGGFVIVEAPPPLLPLLCDAPGIDQLVARGAPLPEFTTQRALLSLPRLFRTDLSNLPARVPYLVADRRRVERWREPIRSLPGLRVGLSWQGSKGFKADRHRSIALQHFTALARLPGVTFLSLQKGYGTEQIPPLAQELPLRELPADTDRDGAFVDTAAILQHLDLVITSDTSMAHLAGALGIPTWVVLPFAADWRWLLGREDSPWYPSLRLFRQKRFGDWPEVFECVAAALAERVPALGAKPSAALAPASASVVEEVEALHRAATVCCEQGQWAEGETQLRAALEKQPQRWDLHQNLAIAVVRQGKFEEAIRLFSAYLDRHPHSPEGYGNLGLACLDAGRFADAARHFRQASRLKPGHSETYNNLGVALLRLGQGDEALTAFRTALSCREDYPEAHANAGSVLRQQKKSRAALPHLQRALALRPTAAVHVDIGLACVELQELEEAERHFRHATELQPQHPDAYNNLGILLADLQQLEDAKARLTRALELRPDSPDTHRNLGIVLLAAGKWDRGWVEYEWRWRCGSGLAPGLPPRWDGSPPAGRTLLVYAEQGNGDTLHFARYLPLLQAQGAQVVFACQPALIPVLQASTLAIERIVPVGTSVPEADASVGLLSLPGLLGTRPDNIPAPVPYLVADPQRCVRWGERLRAIRGFRVGIAWQGSPGYGGDCYRSIPLRRFAALAQVPGVQLISLQKGAGTEQLGNGDLDFMPVDLGRQIDESGGPTWIRWRFSATSI